MVSTVTVFTRIYMANPDQKTILVEQLKLDIKEICKKFKDDSGSTNSEIKDLLMGMANSMEIEKKNKVGFR